LARRLGRRPVRLFSHPLYRENLVQTAYLHQSPRTVFRGSYRGNAVRLPDQDHRAIKRRTRPMMGFKDFRCARIILGGIETMHMIMKWQMKSSATNQAPAEQFYSVVR
jgi:transposase-like protein